MSGSTAHRNAAPGRVPSGWNGPCTAAGTPARHALGSGLVSGQTPSRPIGAHVPVAADIATLKALRGKGQAVRAPAGAMR